MSSQKQNRIHFVCTGNVFRSRLAEAYFRAESLDGWSASSSGIYADGAHFGPITPWAEMLAEENGVSEYLSESWQQTTCKELQAATYVVFINSTHEAWTDGNCDLSAITYTTLDVEDMVGPGLQEKFNKNPMKMKAERGDEMTHINEKIKKYVMNIVNSINEDTLLQ